LNVLQSALHSKFLWQCYWQSSSFWEWAFESLETQVCEFSWNDSSHESLLSTSCKEFSDEQWMSSERRSLLHFQSHYHEYSADERIHWQSKCKYQKSRHWIMSV